MYYNNLNSVVESFLAIYLTKLVECFKFGEVPSLGLLGATVALTSEH